MDNIINLGDHKTEDRNRRTIEIGKLVDLEEVVGHLWDQVREFNGFKLTGGPGSGSTAAIEGCSQLREGLGLMQAGLNKLKVQLGMIEPPEQPKVDTVDDRTKYAALLNDCRTASFQLGTALSDFLRFIDGIPQLDDDIIAERAGTGLCDALDMTIAGMNAFDTAQARIFPSATAETQ